MPACLKLIMWELLPLLLLAVSSSSCQYLTEDQLHDSNELFFFCWLQYDKAAADAAEYKAGFDKLLVDSTEQKAQYDREAAAQQAQFAKLIADAADIKAGYDKLNVDNFEQQAQVRLTLLHSAVLSWPFDCDIISMQQDLLYPCGKICYRVN